MRAKLYANRLLEEHGRRAGLLDNGIFSFKLTAVPKHSFKRISRSSDDFANFL